MENNNLFDTTQQRALLERANEIAQASIGVNKQDRPQTIYRITVDLSVARDILDPYVINFPFRSIFVEQATSPANFVNVKPTTNEEHQSYFSLGYKDSWNTSMIIPKAFLHWPVQVGTITLVVFTDAEFKSGSQVSLTSGGVSISEGSSVSAPTSVTLNAATATVIAPQNFLRKVCILENKSGSNIYIAGTNTVTNAGATEGIIFPPGGILYYKNTGILYGYSVAASKITRVEET